MNRLALDGVGSHDHLCSIYETDGERNAVAVPFLRIGLGRGEKCLYLHSDGKPDDIAQALAADGLDVERFISNGALVIKSKDEAYLRNGRFDAERMLAFWQHESAAAKSEGYSAIRGAGETAWVPSTVPELRHWLHYEARLTDAIALCDCLLLCQYSRARHPPEILLNIIQMHRLVIYDGRMCRNQYYVPGVEFPPLGDAGRTVQRWLRNIRNYGQAELALRRAKERIARERIDMLRQHQRLAEQVGAIAKLQDRLRQADARNSQILESITDMFFSYDKEFRFVHMNRHGAEQMRLAGKEPDRLIGKVVWDEFPDAPNPEALRRVMNERVAVTDEVYYPPLGQWYENRMYPSPDGGMVVFVRNVTQRRRREEARRRGEAYLDAAQRISHTGSWAWNASTGELFWSAEHFRIMGHDPERVKPSREMFFERVHADDREALQEAFDLAVRGRQNFSANFRIVRPDSGIRYMLSEAHPVLDESGTLLEYVGAIVDVTERKESEGAVHKAREELAHVNRALTVAELTASIAHELNQPLAAVVANANACERWLAARPADEAEAQAALRRIIRDANRAAEVIAHVRALLTRHEPDKKPLQLGEAIAEALALVSVDARQKEISLNAELEDRLPPIHADRVRIQQVLLNLLVNAMDALASAPQPRTLTVSAQREGAGVSVRVRDSGPGIEPHSLGRLFEPFFTTKAQGMGMGLAISRSIIEDHGGRIGALNNADGRGATFEFMLPAYTEVQ